tara:strand:+ start:1472 stop:2173 length:702 start_codon:yes stop_codon:yes gene_type:complete
MNLNIDKIYCCHHPSESLSPRKEKLLKIFNDNNLDVEWVEGFSPEDAKQYNHKTLLRNVMTKGPENCRNDEEKATQLTYRSISLILKHNYCYEEQIKNNYENILILEDDVDLSSVFSEDYFNKCMEEFSELNLEMLFLGSCCNLHFPNATSEKFVYYADFLTTRCTHCYVVNQTAATKALKWTYEMIDSVDWQLNWVIDKEKIKTGWAEPSIEQMDYGSSLNHEGDGKSQLIS